MRKTRGLFKKIGDIKETVHAWMSMIKGRNGKDLTEAREIKRWQEYKEELYQKGLNDQDNHDGYNNDQDKHDGVVTHQEPEILECEVKWALVSITMNKASGGDGIAAVLFQILKDDAVKVLLLNMPANLENSAVATGLENISFHSNPKEGQGQRTFKLLDSCAHFTC